MRAAALVAVALLAACSQTEAQGPPTFAFGQPADVQVDAGGVLVPIQATVRLIEPGSWQALEDAGVTVLDTVHKQPFYVRVAYVNTTGRAFTAPVAQQFRPRESDGRYAVRLDIVGATERVPCANPVPPATFGTIGGSAEACVVVVVDDGTSITSVEWAFTNRTLLAVWKPIA